MNREIERRFLVEPKRLPRLRKGRLQIQAYLNTDPETKVEIRIRIENKKAILTLKNSLDTVVRQEFEYKIPLQDAKKLLKLTDKIVKKVRYNLIVEGKKWFIDFFQEKNFPLIIAEIELNNRNEKFSKPLWIKKEITNNPSYTALSLAFKPFQDWTKKDLKKNN